MALLRGTVVGVVQLAGLQTQESAADTAAQHIAHPGQRLDSGVQLCTKDLAGRRPIRFGRRAPLGKGSTINIGLCRALWPKAAMAGGPDSDTTVGGFISKITTASNTKPCNMTDPLQCPGS